MYSDGDDVSVSERDQETQFVPQEDDEDRLWEVIEITEEKGRRYKVRWAGVDPTTRKPWPQSWVNKRDCTDDLVLEWKRRKKEKERRKSQRASTSSRKSRGSTISRLSTASRGSVATTASRPASKAGTASTSRSGSKKQPPQPKSPSPPRNAPNTKRKAPLSDSSSDLPEIAILNEPAHPRKKRKVAVETVVEDADTQRSYEVKPAKAGKVVKRYEEEEEEDEEFDELSDDLKELNARTRTQRKPKSNKLNNKTPAVKKASSNLCAPPKPISKTQLTPAKASSDYDIIIVPPPKKQAPQPSKKAGKIVESSDHDVPVVRTSKAASSSRPQTTSAPTSRTAQTASTAQTVPKPVTPRLSPAAKARLVEFDAWIKEFDATAAKRKEDNKIPAPSFASPARSAPPRSPSPPESHLAHPASPNSVHERKSEDDFVDFGYSEPDPQPLFIPPSSPSPPPPEPPAPVPPTKKAAPVRPTSSKGVPNISQEVIPETEPESSANNTQSQSQSQMPQPASPQRPAAGAAPLAVTPSRNSLISRMKPRTPMSGSHSNVFIPEQEALHPIAEAEQERVTPRRAGAETAGDVAGAKPLRPIPRLSPSRFAPHLSSAASDGGDDADAEEEEEEDEEEESIEQFSSPAKRTFGPRSAQLRTNGKKKAKEKVDGNAHPEPSQDVSVTDVDDSELAEAIKERGIRLADRARKERLRLERGEDNFGQKKPLAQILKAPRQDKGKGKARAPESDQEPDSSSLSRNNDERRSTSPLEYEERGLSLTRTEDEAQDLEDAYLDLEGGMGTGDPKEDARYALREEEEENTQDLARERMEREHPQADVEMRDDRGPHPPPSPLHGEGQDDEESAEAEADALAVEKQLSQEPLEVLQQPVAEPSRPLLSRHSSGAKSAESAPKHVPQEESQEVLPPTASVLESTPLQASLSEEQALEKDGPLHLGAAMALLNSKSLEISRLDGLLSAEQTKNAALIREAEALRQASAAANDALQTLETELKWEVTQLQQTLEQERTSWAAEHEKLTASIASVEKAKSSASDDRDFFQKQYMQASSFVTSVRQENEELESKARIAEEQAKTGVAMVKATFEQRIKALEDDAKAWKKLALFLVEKDVRTNDEIRRRAAEEPELRAKCCALEEDNEMAYNQIAIAEARLEVKDDEVASLKAELELWKGKAELYETEVDALKGRSMEGEAAETIEEDKVYVCKWRLDGTEEVCHGLFASMEDLERHVFEAGHIQES